MFRAASIAVTLALAAGSAVLAQGASPVMITSMTIHPAFIGGAYPQPGSVTVSFLNLAQVPATEIDFALISKTNGAVYRRTALTGTFTAGTEIKHAWTTQVTETDQTGVVTRVKFANGTMWTRSATPPVSRP